MKDRERDQMRRDVETQRLLDEAEQSADQIRELSVKLRGIFKAVREAETVGHRIHA